MKLYAIIEVNDDMYDEFKEWYITADDLEIRYDDDNVLMLYKAIENDMLELKPLPSKLPSADIMKVMAMQQGINLPRPHYTEEYEKGYNKCIDEILGEEHESTNNN